MHMIEQPQCYPLAYQLVLYYDFNYYVYGLSCRIPRRYQRVPFQTTIPTTQCPYCALDLHYVFYVLQLSAYGAISFGYRRDILVGCGPEQTLRESSYLGTCIADGTHQPRVYERKESNNSINIINKFINGMWSCSLPEDWLTAYIAGFDPVISLMIYIFTPLA